MRRVSMPPLLNFGTDAQQNMNDGVAGLYMFLVHGAGACRTRTRPSNSMTGKYSASIGTSAGNNRYSRYKNPEYDKILDEMAPLGSDDPKFKEGMTNALGIYWRDTIDIPIIQWLHRIPYNNTYWTNWPSSTNPAMGTNGAFWAHTGTLVITALKPSGAK